MTTINELDTIDGEILAKRIAGFNRFKGPRVGDFVIMPDGQYRRFTHNHGKHGLQTTCGSDNADASRSGGASFYLGHFGMDYSGGLDPCVKQENLVLTEEVRDGHAWFFHHDRARAHNGVEFTVPCRVYRFRAGDAAEAWLVEKEARAVRMREWEAGRITF